MANKKTSFIPVGVCLGCNGLITLGDFPEDVAEDIHLTGMPPCPKCKGKIQQENQEMLTGNWQDTQTTAKPLDEKTFDIWRTKGW